MKKFINGSVVLETINSQYNGQIKVDEDLFGKRRLLVGGITQSGPAVENIWQKAMRDNRYWELEISNCLILGLGAGNAAKIINNYFPDAKITGIEIDPEIVKLGKKYFGLKELKNLKIELKDAFLSVDNCINGLIHCNSAFDLVLVDLYLGDYFPAQAGETRFLESLNKTLKPNGTVIFNRLYYGNNKEKTDKFEQKIRKVFTQTEAKKVQYNKIFLCRK